MEKGKIIYNLLTEEIEYNADEYDEKEIEEIKQFARNMTLMFSEFDIENQN